LSNKEYELLRVLLEEAGAVVTRNRIMREVWDDAEGGASKTLDMHVSWLRRKLGDDPQRPRLRTTVRGGGFRFGRGWGIGSGGAPTAVGRHAGGGRGVRVLARAAAARGDG